MHFQRALLVFDSGPGKYRYAKTDSCSVQAIKRVGELELVFGRQIAAAGQQLEKQSLINPPVPLGIGVGKRIAADFVRQAKMIEPTAVGRESRFYLAQAFMARGLGA